MSKIKRTAKPYDTQKLLQLEQSQGVKFEQAEKIRLLNGTLETWQGIEKTLREGNINGFNDMGYSQQQAMISQYLGISQEQRKATAAEYLGRVAEGKITKSEIDWAESMGYIQPDEEYIKDTPHVNWMMGLDRGHLVYMNTVDRFYQHAYYIYHYA